MTAISISTFGAAPERRASPTQARPRWTIDISALDDSDQARMRALLYRAQEHTAHGWMEAGDDGADVRLVDEDGGATVPMQLRQPKVVVQIVDVDAPIHRVYENHRLVRPLLLGDFVVLLQRLETRLHQKGDPPVTSESAAAPMPAESAPSARPANEGVYAVSPAYQLRKWPPVNVLLREDAYTQLATLFSAQHLTMAQASRMSRVRYTQCWAFIKECMALGLVEVYKPTLMTNLGAAAAATTPTAPRIQRNASRGGLFARLVAYLG